MTTETALTIPHAFRERGNCFNCISRLREDVSRLKGVKRVDNSEDLSQLLIQFAPLMTSLEVIERYVAQQGLKVTAHYGHEHYTMDGLACPDCAAKLQTKISRLEGIRKSPGLFCKIIHGNYP